MTFLATFLDLIPMAIGMGKGQRGERAAGPGGGGRPVDLDLLDVVRRADHVHLAIEDKHEELDIEAELADLPEPHTGQRGGADCDPNSGEPGAKMISTIEWKQETIRRLHSRAE